MIDVTVTPSENVTMGRGPARGPLVTTHKHIPGTVLRGALANAWLIEHGKHAAKSPEFVNLFERGVRFGPLFAPGSSVTPLSVHRCKYRSTEECRWTWYDEASDCLPAACEHCSGPLERGRGEVEFLTDSPVRRRTRAALDEDETASEGMLFDRDELTPGAGRCFVGCITGGGGWLQQEHELFLGGKRSTSGAATYVPSLTAEPSLPDLSGGRLVLRCLSPAIFVDESGRPTLEPDVNRLSATLGCALRLEHKWVRRDRINGWHMASELPKPEELAVTAGSVFLFELDDDPDPQRLRALLEDGIGLRRVEGFGALAIGPATQPIPPQTEQAPATPGVPETASMLTSISKDLQKWLRDELKRYLVQLNDREPHTGLLRIGKGHQFGGKPRQVLKDVLERGEPGEINQLIQVLDNSVRETTS